MAGIQSFAPPLLALCAALCLCSPTTNSKNLILVVVQLTQTYLNINKGGA